MTQCYKKGIGIYIRAWPAFRMSYNKIFQSVPLTKPDIDTDRADRGEVRNVLVHIAGNRATWEHLGVHGAVWRVNQERADTIFSYSNGYNAKGDLSIPKEDRLSRAMIKRVSILESSTNIEECVGIVIDGLPPNEFTANGDGAACFLTGSGRMTTPQEVFCLTGNTELGLAWMNQFPQYTSENLNDVGVMFLTGATYYFVHEGHPAIQMLRASQDELGVQITSDTTVDGQWYKIDVETFTFCVKTLREGVLLHAPSTFDLSQLTVRLTKPDRQGWLYISAQSIDNLITDAVKESDDKDLLAQSKAAAIQRYLDRPLFVTLRLAIEYSLVDTRPPTTAVSAPSVTYPTAFTKS